MGKGTRGCLAAAVLVAATVAVPAVEPVRIEARARAVAPGEPLRLVARAPVALRSLGGRFLDQDLSFRRLEAGEGPQTWAAWAVVPLDGAPGPAAVEVRGVTADGVEAAGTLALTVEARDFPEERLEVESRYVEPPAEVLARIRAEKERVAEIYARRSDAQPPSEPFVRPVPGEPTSIFGLRRIFNGKPRSPHPGLDLRAAEGTPVHAAGPGRVALAEELYYSGNLVIVDHGGGLLTLYAHLSRIDVPEGQEVAAGDVLGLSGSSGRVTGPHLHWGAKIGEVAFDPRALLDAALFAGRP